MMARVCAFRDDRQALLERVQALEGELARAGPGQDRLRAELDELRRKVQGAVAALEEDRRGLDEVAGVIARLTASVDPPAAAEAGAADPAARSVNKVPPAFLILGTVGGLIILLLLVALCVGKGGTSVESVADPSLRPAGQLPGFPHAVDPVALLPLIRGAVDAQRELHLVSIKVRYAGSDGLVDLDGPGYQGKVAYRFEEKQEPNPDKPPPGPRPPLGVEKVPPRIFSTTWSVDLDRTGLHVNTNPFMLPLDRPAADPTCSVKQVWAAALAAGAPAHAVARLGYADGFGGSGWSFEIEGTDFRLAVADPGCESKPDPLAPQPLPAVPEKENHR